MRPFGKLVILVGFLLLAGSAFAQKQNDLGLRPAKMNFVRQTLWLSETMADNGFSGHAVQWQKIFFRTELTVFRPNRLVWTSGWNVYLLRAEIRQRVASNLVLCLNGQAFNSFFHHGTVNWGWGPAAELTVSPYQQIFIQPFFGYFEGRPYKTFSIGYRIGFHFGF